MSRLRDDALDVIDSSFEMPEQYGSRTYWRYNQIMAWIGFIAVPILVALSFFDQTSSFGHAVWIGGFTVIGAAAIFVIVRDRKAQKRMALNGSPLAEREPF